MTFQSLQYHLEDNACSLDPYLEDSYMAMNLLSLDQCVIEKLPRYSIPTLCHYFYELSIPAPPPLAKHLEVYRKFRKKLDKLAVHEIRKGLN